MMNNYNHGKIKENYFKEILEKWGFCAVIKQKTVEGKEVAQTWIDNGYYKCSPDIDIFENKESKKIIIRVEIKGLSNLKVIKGEKFVYIPVNQYSDYRDLFFLSEIPTYVVFVVGKEEYKYWWASVIEFDNTEKFRINYQGAQDNKPKPYYFININNLKSNLDDLFWQLHFEY